MYLCSIDNIGLWQPINNARLLKSNIFMCSDNSAEHIALCLCIQNSEITHFQFQKSMEIQPCDNGT